MIDPAEPRRLEALLAGQRVRARRSLGQNFLVDPGLRDRVVDAARIGPEDEVLEVGAGPGTLTYALGGRCRRVVAVELDSRLLPILRDVTRDLPAVEVVAGDILKLDLARYFPKGGEVVVGNIPYYLTGALLRRLLEEEPRPRRLSLVLQKEVAERLTTQGSWSLASVAVHTYAVPRLALRLPAAAFDPVPAVDSALVVMEVRDRPAVEVGDMNAFFRFVEAIFQFRRKQLGAAAGRVTGRGSASAGSALRAVGVEPSRRAETLSIAEWETVYRSLAL